MLVSIIIPVYNSENFIDKAIESVLNQTYQNFEIIVIDDGSTDKTKEVIQSFQDKRILYEYQENSGPAAARNNGIKISNGELLAFLDSDDIWESHKLETQAKILLNNPNICMVYNHFTLKPEGDEHEKLVKFKNHNREDFIKNLLIKPFLTIPYPSTVMLKKSFLDQAGYFNTELKLGEDWDLWFRLAKLADCSCIDKVLTKRYTPKSSITRSINPQAEIAYHLKILKNFFDNNPEYNKYRSMSYSGIFCNLAGNYFYKNNKTPSKNVYINILKSLQLNPLFILSDIKKIKFVLNVIIKTLILKGIFSGAKIKE